MTAGDTLVLQHPPTEPLCSRCHHPLRHHHLSVKWAMCLNDLTGRYIGQSSSFTTQEVADERWRRAEAGLPDCSGDCRIDGCPAWINR